MIKTRIYKNESDIKERSRTDINEARFEYGMDEGRRSQRSFGGISKAAEARLRG
jgi:hypothetical protein